MKDIDFDELDRAVSSLMSGRSSKTAGPVTPASEPVVSEEQPPAADTTTMSTPDDTSAPKVVSVEPKTEVSAPDSKPIAPTVTSPIVPQRRSGRFMDVVHPSSDMKSSNTMPNRPKSIVAPINTDTAAESVEKKTEVPVFDPLTMTSVEKASTSQKTSGLSEPEVKKQDDHSWPDPIDVHEKSMVPETPAPALSDDSSSSTAAEAPTTKAEDNSAPNEQENSDYIETTSPFLPDAKVEKRPLGGTPSTVSVKTDDKTSKSLPVPEEKDAIIDDDLTSKENNELTDEASVSDDAKGDSSKPIEPLPAELSKDIIAVEAGGTIHEPDTLEKDGSRAEQGSNPKSAKEHAPAPGMTSITQQYKIKTATTTPEHMPIYADNGQPLSHPKKTKSGWLTILWIIGLIIVGTGGTLALYFFNVI
jgi:hypothetical protein